MASPGKPPRANQIASLPFTGKNLPGRARLAEGPAVVTVTTTIVGVELLSVTELGTEHVDCAGAPVHVSDTVWVKPPAGATATV